MAPNICQRLIDKVWRSFANDLGQIPQAEGIYTIGFEQTNGIVKYLYVGHSKNMHRRVPEHKWQKLAIDQFIKKQFEENGGKNLKIKWVEDKDGKCKEGGYINCMEQKLEYTLKHNIKRGPQMASNICQRLIDKVWTSFANDLGQIPQAEGIYTIGGEQTNGIVEYLYVGHSKNMHRRVPEHKWQKLAVDQFIKKQFEENGGKNLKIKWVEDKDGKCKEGGYINCMEQKLEYTLKYNIKGGNQC